jgi:uncharacterized DUF497 family protein
MEFEWDDSKAETNFQKHGVRFSEAATIWQDEHSLEIPDPEHSKQEDRWIRLGISRNANVLVVVYVEKIEGERIRIISARRANKIEEKQYVR